jgi:hypothetical protein
MTEIQVLDKMKLFDVMPDDAVVDDRVAAAVLGISVRTLKRNDSVPPVQLSTRRMGRRVGSIRALARGEKPAA